MCCVLLYPLLLLNRYEPSEKLLDVYETVYKIRTTLLAHKNSTRTSQVQAAAKQVQLLKLNNYRANLSDV